MIFFFFLIFHSDSVGASWEQTVETLIQTPRSVASDLGLRCLPMSHKGTIGLNGLRIFS